MTKLAIRALCTLAAGVLALAAALLIPTRSVPYWQAWVFMAVLVVCVAAIGLYLAARDPALLERRLRFGPTNERSSGQKILISIVMALLAGGCILCAVAHRFAWCPVPAWASLPGDVLVALGLLICLRVFRENSYAGSTVETVAGQRVVSTGPYARVRHPMYAGVMIAVTGVPFALDAWWGLALVVVGVPLLVWRILDEERTLRRELPGYLEYKQSVRYRLVPHLW